MKKKIYVIKANGQKVPFDPNKVIGTCIRAGARSEIAKKIARKTHEMVRNGITTKEVYRIVLRNISEFDESHVIKHRYGLKDSIMKMGPIGLPFESYMSQILPHYGYEINDIRSEVNGRCVKHEIDLIATLDRKKIMVECKFHRKRGIHTGLKISLYTHARFLDLNDQFDGEMLCCNTRLSNDALEYATCVDQKILCWKHPQDNGLERMIEDKGLYPITILNLNRIELSALAKINFMLAKDLLTTDLSMLSRKTNISFTRLQRLKNRVKLILNE